MKIHSNKDKGITLVALVITIIVMLILVGVSVVVVIDENGILKQAAIARDKVLAEETMETIKFGVLCSYGTNGILDEEQLHKNLKNIDGLTYKDNALSDSNKISSLPIIVTLKGYEIEINKDGEIRRVPEIISQIIDNPKAYYGKKVTNYKDDGQVYRIFYVDKENYFGDGDNTIYLKADYSDRIVCSTSYDINQTKVREMNPSWAEKRGSSESEWNVNEKAAAWLCDPSKWVEYCDTEKANYSIGAPSVEMYVQSYNEAYKGKEGFNVLGAKYRGTNVPGYIYTLNGAQSTISKNDYTTGDNSLNFTEYSNMYCGKNGSKTGDWWLASPCALDYARVCFVYGYGAKIDYRNYNSGNLSSISPLISLKSSFIPEFEEENS